jgi:tRNA(adenine34) deaminase
VVVQKIEGQNKRRTEKEDGEKNPYDLSGEEEDFFFEVLSKAHNKVETLHDATAHAELLALRQTSQQQKNWRLYNTTLYTTLEPCPMCLSSCQAFRVGHVVYGARDLRLGAVESFISLLSLGPPHPYHPRMNVTGGVMAAQCGGLMKTFFIQRRAQKKKGTKNKSLNDVMGDRGRNLVEESSGIATQDSSTKQTAEKLTGALETRKKTQQQAKFQEKVKCDSEKIASGDLEYQSIMDELATAEKNVLDAEKELVELEEKEKLAKEEEKAKNTTLLKQEESKVLELDAPKTFRNLIPFNKREKRNEPLSKKKVTKENIPDNAKRVESEKDSATEEEVEFSTMTPKQILEKHILDNTATEMERIEEASLAKAEEDMLRIFSDLEQLKQVAGSDDATDHTDADAAIVTPEPDVAFGSGDGRFAKVADTKLGPEQFTKKSLEPTSVGNAVKDTTFPPRLGREKDPTNITEDAPKRSVTDRLSFWKGSGSGEGEVASTDEKKKKRLADVQGAAKAKLDILSEEYNEDDEYVDSILNLDLDLDLGDFEIEENEVLGL